jgi:hypothetical protein|tara:strand:- start:3805 stop:4317 length:513 start_codon:yes stop_codon:yes gene_type:complete
MADTITKDPKKQWDRTVRDNARDLYLTGNSVSEIASELDVPVPTVRYWQNKDNWTGFKRNLELSTNDSTLDGITSTLTRSRSQAVQDYIRIQEVGIEGIYDEELRFRDKKQAVDALAIGLKGERELLNQNVSMQLILEIAKVLDEEITDPFIRQRVGNKLAAIGQLYAAD